MLAVRPSVFPAFALPLPHCSIISFKLYYFVCWFLVPFLICARSMDWQFFTFKRWTKQDKFFLAGCLIIGVAAVSLIHWVPSLQQAYPTLGKITQEKQVCYALNALAWNISWLLGWEFLHRYALPRSWSALFPKHGWMVAPIVEFLFHLQKPFIEAVGMLLFSIVATQWSLRRRNLLLPLLVHTAIEVTLVLIRLGY